LTEHPEIVEQIELQNGKIIRLVRGDITSRHVDAVVNASNSYLKHGGGVAAAIVRKGGQEIQEESNKIGFVPVGSAAITTCGKLPCKAVIHAVGPRMGEGNEDVKLRSAIRTSLLLATERKFRDIAIPAVSSGIFGFPKDRCAAILTSESLNFLLSGCNDKRRSTLEIVEFCIIDSDTLKEFRSQFRVLKNDIVNNDDREWSERRMKKRRLSLSNKKPLNNHDDLINTKP
jgi:O-acetyl-ADP-ribose deacetylase (regulator of RNase III)